MRKSKQISILFIGNSFSYYHALPKLLARFAKTSDLGHLTPEGVFRGGATLKGLWEDGRALKKLRSRRWDYVVLQERGRLGGIIKNNVVHVGKPQDFFTYAGRFHREIKKIGAETILYCPPAFLGMDQPGDVKKLNTIYRKLGRKLNALVIPSGMAFMLALKKRPQFNLYESDKGHPNSLGMYLVASLFYKKLFNKKAENLPLVSYLSRSERIPKKPKIIKLQRADARFLWSIANQLR